MNIAVVEKVLSCLKLECMTITTETYQCYQHDTDMAKNFSHKSAINAIIVAVGSISRAPDGKRQAFALRCCPNCNL